jgi:hypothetical protein
MTGNIQNSHTIRSEVRRDRRGGSGNVNAEPLPGDADTILEPTMVHQPPAKAQLLRDLTGDIIAVSVDLL